jgi:hypothetical protein
LAGGGDRPVLLLNAWQVVNGGAPASLPNPGMQPTGRRGAERRAGGPPMVPLRKPKFVRAPA